MQPISSARWLSLRSPLLMFQLAKSSEDRSMSDYIWTGAVCLLLIIYLVYALIKPEKF